MKKIKYLLLTFLGLSIIVIIAIVCHLNYDGDKVYDGDEVHVSTERDAFVSVNPGKRVIEEINDEFYLLIDITPAKFPEEADTIYHSAKKGKTVFITITDRSPEVKFVIKGGLNKDGYMRIKCESREEAKTLSSRLGLPWFLYLDAF
jgi:hypothetical protein